MFAKNKNNRKTQSQTSRRSPLTTYYRGESRPGTDSPFTKKPAARPTRKYLFRLLDVIIAAVVLYGVGYSLMIKPDPKVMASDLTFHSLSDYRAAAAAELSHFGNRNKITFDQQGLTASLKQRFPEISSAEIELPLFSQKPTIRLSIDQASLFLNSRGNRYIVDSGGRAVAKASSLPDVKHLPVVEDQSGFDAFPGRQVFSSDSVNFIATLVAECRRASVPISSITLPAVPQELDLRTADQPYYVKFYLGGDVLSQSGQFLAARKHFSQTRQSPSVYLDVRVPGKVFFK